MGKKGWLICIAIWLAISSSLVAIVYYTALKPQSEARNEFIDRRSEMYQRGRSANKKLIALNKELSHLMDESARPPQEFGGAKMIVTASVQALSNAKQCFDKIHDRSSKDSIKLDYVNDLLSLAERHIQQAEELNKLLEQEIKDLQNAESPK